MRFLLKARGKLPHLCWSWHCLFLSPEAVGEAGSGLPSYGNRGDQTSVSLLAVSGQKQLNFVFPIPERAVKLVFCSLLPAQVFKFSLAILRGEMTSQVFF